MTVRSLPGLGRIKCVNSSLFELFEQVAPFIRKPAS
jgi:hypothetical protein